MNFFHTVHRHFISVQNRQRINPICKLFTQPRLQLFFERPLFLSIQIDKLEEHLMQMAVQEAPGRDFCLAISKMAGSKRFENLRSILPAVVYQELHARHQADPQLFIAEWHKLSQEMQQGFLQHARQRLTSLTRLQQPTTQTHAWKQIQLALDHQQNDLLRAAFALELLQLVEPAVARATHLRECVVNSSCSEQADRYLDEATRCYFYGLFTACAVMCRSVLEEAIKQRLPERLTKIIRSRYRNTATLGNLLHEVNNNLIDCAINPDFPHLANRVNDIGKKAVHQGLLGEDEARHSLQTAREALELLLRATP